MASEDAETRDANARADASDATGDDRQRLADERERLADERENLADQRERLADDQERLLDQRGAAVVDHLDPDAALDEERSRAEAADQLARADARLRRAILGRERARAAIERLELTSVRHVADAERAARRGMPGDEGWELERRAFVAVERERIADRRDDAQDVREELADRRERAADDRDRAAREREDAMAAFEHRHAWDAATANKLSLLEGSEIQQVRAAGARQRQDAARTRRRARSERAEMRRLGAASPFMPEAEAPRLAAEFMALTRELFASGDLSEVASRVLGFAVDLLPGDLAAGAAISGGGLPMLRVATGPVAEHLDAFQLETGCGPAVDALRSPEPVLATTLASWPDLATRGAELGVTGALAHGLAVPRDGGWHALGVLTLYAEDASSLGDETLDACSIFAAYLAVAAGLERDRNDLSRREAALHRALNTRDVIGQAKGILMERRRILAGEAFDILRKTSQRLNVKVHEVAARLAETGDLMT